MADSYDIASVCHLIRERGFTAVVLQVPDENLSDAADLYAEINKAIPDLDLYLTADSTYGSSVDDVSALHVDGKLLVYFGSDMSVSGSMPVVVCPRRAVLDIPAVASALREEFTKVLAGNDKNVLLLVEPAYFHLIVEIEEAFRAMIPSIIVGKVPACADPKNWMVEKDLRATIASQYDLIGSMLVPKDIVVDDLVVCIISDKRDQIVNSCLRYSNNDVVCYSPAEQRIFSNKGVVLQEYRERFLGVSRVKDASVIGLIVGSMGLSGQVIQVTVARLQALIQAAGKTSYCFVMGRLNESKLRNFPEVDVFCLVANDDTALISPKYVHFLLH
jgi:diphthamide biosynthesis protein 2